MHYRVGRVFLIAALLGLMLGSLPATSAPTGKTVTSEITIAGGLVAYFLTYESALLRSKGSVKQAEQVMAAITDADNAVSLNQIRGLIIVDVANAPAKDQTRWRDEFENFRFCWNKALAIDPSAPQSKNNNLTGASHAVVAAAIETPSTPPPYRKPSCTDLLGNVLGNIPQGSSSRMRVAVHNLDTEVDLPDLYPALETAPSLFSQVRNQNVGSHILEDYLQARFLTVAGKHLAALIAAPTPKPKPSATLGLAAEPIAASTVLQFISNCIQLNSPADCAGQFAEIEGSLESAQKQRDGCAWDRHVWMPSYTAIKIWAGLPSGAAWRDRIGRPMPFVTATPLNIETYDASSKKTAIDATDMMDLGSPPGC